MRACEPIFGRVGGLGIRRRPRGIDKPVSKRILILGDDQEFVLSARALLAKHYDVTATGSGEAGLALAERLVPDLVLL